MKSRFLLSAVALAIAGHATPSYAAQVFVATLSGGAEVPARVTPGTGSARLVISGARDTITITANFSGLTANTIAAHVHCCSAPTANAMVAIETPSLPGFPLGVRAGSFSNSFSLLDANSYNPAFVSAHGGTAIGARDFLVAGLVAGGSYFNIHSVAFPGGEIRGQFAAIPEPASWALMIAGFGLVGGASRMRRRALQSA